MNMSAATLLVIDVQKDFCPGGSLAVPDGDAVIPVINGISHLFENVVATGDWHPQGHISFASRHGKKPFQTLKLDGMDQKLWPEHCVSATRGAEFHAGLDTSPFNLILHKGSRRDLDSYSAFCENDRNTPTGLHYYLRGLKRREVYVCGLALDVCVFYTVMDALELGFSTYVIEDASRGIDDPEGSVAQAVREMRKKGALVVHAGDIGSS